MTVQVGDVSPTETEPLRQWLLALPDGAILTDCRCTAHQRTRFDRLTPPGAAPRDINTKSVWPTTPFTVVWLPTAAEPPAAP